MIISPTAHTELFALLTSQSQMPFLMGAPGIGKTTIIRDLEKLNTTPDAIPAPFEAVKVFILAVNECAIKDDLVSRRIYPQADGSFTSVFVFHPVIEQALAFAHNNPNTLTVLALDEINRGSLELTTVPMAMSASRRLGDVDLPSNLYLVATGNDEGTVVPLDEAALNRMILLPTKATYAQWAIFMAVSGQPLHPSVVKAFVQDSSLKISDAHDDRIAARFERVSTQNFFAQSMNQVTSPRALTNLCRYVAAIGPSGVQDLSTTASEVYRDQSLLVETILGFLGTTRTSLAIIEQFLADLTSASVPVIDLPLAATKPSMVRVTQGLKSYLDTLENTQDTKRDEMIADYRQVIIDLLAHALSSDTFYEDGEVKETYAQDLPSLLETIKRYIDRTGIDSNALTTALVNSLYCKNSSLIAETISSL